MKKLISFILMLVLTLSSLAGCSSSKKDNEVPKEKTVPAVDAKLIVNQKIHIDQIGYRTKDNKVLIISGKAGSFDVIDSKTGKSVYSGNADTTMDDSTGPSGDIVYYGDFSGVQTPGSYYIEVKGFGKSYTFTISDDVFDNVKNATLKGLYYQRCGIELDAKYAGVWAHDACHLSDGILYTSQDKLLDGKGGWHDAGDYGRYSVAAAVTAAHIMLAYDYFPSVFSDSSNIPESGNKVPDVLDEARYGLEWLLKMQDKNSGGVYHKLTSSGFPDLTTMPNMDFADIYFTPVSSTATGDFAAVMAMAARIFKPYDSKFSNKCLAASQKAWSWLNKNKDFVYENPADITTGTYADSNDSDERFWAASELFRTTGKSQYDKYIVTACNNGSVNADGFGWQNVGGLGIVAYLNSDKSKIDESIKAALQQRLLDGANAYLETGKLDAYKVSLTSNDYNWGSNMNVMNDAMQLIIADKLNPNAAFVQAAEDNLHYLLGRNTMDKAYVTGLGSNSVLQPHHRPSIGDGIEAPVPGLVVGGPNKGLEDDTAKSKLQGSSPAKCYIDDFNSYSTNEIDTYWTSPTIFVAACFSSK